MCVLYRINYDSCPDGVTAEAKATNELLTGAWKGNMGTAIRPYYPNPAQNFFLSIPESFRRHFGGTGRGECIKVYDYKAPSQRSTPFRRGGMRRKRPPSDQDSDAASGDENDAGPVGAAQATKRGRSSSAAPQHEGTRRSARSATRTKVAYHKNSSDSEGAAAMTLASSPTRSASAPPSPLQTRSNEARPNSATVAGVSPSLRTGAALPQSAGAARGAGPSGAASMGVNLADLPASPLREVEAPTAEQRTEGQQLRDRLRGVPPNCLVTLLHACDGRFGQPA